MVQVNPEDYELLFLCCIISAIIAEYIILLVQDYLLACNASFVKKGAIYF